MYQRLSRIGLQGLQQAQSKGFRFFSNESDIRGIVASAPVLLGPNFLNQQLHHMCFEGK